MTHEKVKCQVSEMKCFFGEIKQRRVGKDNIGLPGKVYRCFG